ncbi:MAG: TylF/MycF/NovP-related O-methyltransferase [Planctomycetia bacterium]|nr:TylF/MycF/NovP-related O-methyltransferase [Planctomycetia bacterium]
MIELPDFERAWDFENGFYLTSDPSRLGKLLAHYELFRLAMAAPGAIVECGVFKGASLARFAMFRRLFDRAAERPIVGFDSFGPFPTTAHEPDQALRERFISAAGGESISTDQLRQVLARKGCGEDVELVAGDITRTVPEYLAKYPELTISLLNLDTDLYEPAQVILEQLYPRIAPGGILLLDDYGVFPGETRAVDEYFGGQAEIRRLSFGATPAYVVKEA